MTHALFYQNPVALDKTVHGDLSVASQLSFGFTRHINAVPITLVELPHIMPFFPIAFSVAAPASPLAVLGLRNQENLFLDENGNWLENTYIPAYIRRYPFIFAKDPNRPDQLALCVDDADGILQKNNDNPLFDADGNLGKATQNALDFCRAYQVEAEKTLEFSTALEQSDILTDRHAEIRINENQVITLSGFRQIDETKFNTLPKEIIAEWHEKKWLGAIYAALHSDRNWNNLFQLMEKQLHAQDAQNDLA